MHHRKMKVAGKLIDLCTDFTRFDITITLFLGFVTNGEFNRACEYKRPVSVFKIKADVRSKYGKKGEAALLAMLTPQSMSLYKTFVHINNASNHAHVEKPDGTIVAVAPHPAVPTSLLREILSWRSEGATDLVVISKLRQRTVPEGYTPHPWNPGLHLR